MLLDTGTRLGPYEIQAALGAGGMGEVYKARDTRLDRTVAIKVLPAELNADPERRARFEREAKTIAGLSHPHICTLYDVGEHLSAGSGQAALYLVMEHLDGETLADRLRRGPLPVAQALEFGAQIGDALDAAHKHGVIHRDLKPGNVMLTTGGAGRSGTVSAKLLDFGLAKLAAHGERPALATEASVATQTLPVTARGHIVGTLQYMAPEQLEGRAVDARTDLWALGALLHEMVTGKRAFEAESDVSLIGAILNTDPPALSTLQPLTPPSLERVVKKCLAKRPDDRWDTAHDLADELRWTAQASDTWTAASSARPHHAGRRRAWLISAVGLAGLVAGAGVTWFLRPAPQAARGVVRSLLSVGPAERLQSDPDDITYGEQRPSRHAFAITPDGRRLVFSGVKDGVQQLYMRPIDELEAAPVPDTEGGANPFCSPDGRWIAFWANGAIRKVAVAGGPSTVVCETGPIFGAAWGEDDAIVFARVTTPLLSVPSTGGTPRPLTTLDARKGEVSHRLPFMLPGGQGVLFTAVTHYLPNWDDGEIVVQRLPGGERKTIARGADARYVATGHLLFARWGTLVASPFDLQRLELADGATTIVNDVMQAANTPNSGVESGAAQMAVSPSGLLAYATGGIFRDQERELVWVDRSGHEQLLPLPPRAYLGPHLSPDGQRVLLWTQGRDRIVWVYDLRRGTMTRLTAEGRNSRSIWMPDGRRVTYAAGTTGPEEVVTKASDGSGSVERLSIRGAPSSWSPDGSVLALQSDQGDDSQIIWLFRPGAETPARLTNSRFHERYAEFSPDGRWVAYTSDETGRSEVYIQSFPGPGERKQISNNGGTQPAWARSGRELFYTEIDLRTRRTRMMSVPLEPRPTLAAGVPRLLFEGVYRDQANTRGFDVTPDGQRFLMVRPKARPPSPVSQLVLVQNWFEELKAKVSAGGAK